MKFSHLLSLSRRSVVLPWALAASLASAALAVVASDVQAFDLHQAASSLRTKLGAQAAPIDGTASISVGFSPGNAESLVLGEIAAARQTIEVAAYSFTSPAIAKALVAAHKRGIQVRAVLDKSQLSERYSGATFLANEGVPVRIDSRYAIMHNKFLVIDGQTVETGSFNYTKAAAEKNAENAIVIRGVPSVVQSYATEWKRLWDESEPIAARH
jgi:phosphatidylserine/phosphatidylglycerophosphate/cardiolipin synthase-like enzyme